MMFLNIIINIFCVCISILLSFSGEEKETFSSISICNVFLWGELAAWHAATDLAKEMGSLEAKMGATGQAFDEVRHFFVLRQPPPPHC